MALEPLPLSHAAIDRFVEACIEAGVDASTCQSVIEFCRQRHVGLAEVTQLAQAGTLRGPELGEALKAAVVLVDACENRRLGPEVRANMRQHALAPLNQGRVRFQLVQHPQEGERDPLEGARAAYRWKNNPGDQQVGNALLVRVPGLDISTPESRGVLLHEMQHVVQDARELANSRYGFEQDAHRVYADYLMRESGAIVEDVNGITRCDISVFNGLVSGIHEGTDRHQARELFIGTLERLAKQGHIERITPPITLDELKSFAAGDRPDVNFTTQYDASVAQSGRKPKHAEWIKWYQKDGI